MPVNKVREVAERAHWPSLAPLEPARHAARAAAKFQPRVCLARPFSSSSPCPEYGDDKDGDRNDQAKVAFESLGAGVGAGSLHGADRGDPYANTDAHDRRCSAGGAGPDPFERCRQTALAAASARRERNGA